MVFTLRTVKRLNHIAGITNCCFNSTKYYINVTYTIIIKKDTVDIDGHSTISIRSMSVVGFETI